MTSNYSNKLASMNEMIIQIRESNRSNVKEVLVDFVLSSLDKKKYKGTYIAIPKLKLTVEDIQSITKDFLDIHLVIHCEDENDGKYIITYDLNW